MTFLPSQRMVHCREEIKISRWALSTRESSDGVHLACNVSTGGRLADVMRQANWDLK